MQANRKAMVDDTPPLPVSDSSTDSDGDENNHDLTATAIPTSRSINAIGVKLEGTHTGSTDTDVNDQQIEEAAEKVVGACYLDRPSTSRVCCNVLPITAKQLAKGRTLQASCSTNEMMRSIKSIQNENQSDSTVSSILNSNYLWQSKIPARKCSSLLTMQLGKNSENDKDINFIERSAMNAQHANLDDSAEEQSCYRKLFNEVQAAKDGLTKTNSRTLHTEVEQLDNVPEPEELYSSLDEISIKDDEESHGKSSFEKLAADVSASCQEPASNELTETVECDKKAATDLKLADNSMPNVSHKVRLMEILHMYEDYTEHLQSIQTPPSSESQHMPVKPADGVRVFAANETLDASDSGTLIACSEVTLVNKGMTTANSACQTSQHLLQELVMQATTSNACHIVDIEPKPSVSGISEFSLAKFSANSVLAPCERTFHTLQIEATSTPSSSDMHRPPLCLRLWHVFTDFFTAICVCLQVNKDCIFCLGFMIIFVVSASFLTAFFYHALSVTPTFVQQQQQQQSTVFEAQDGKT